MWENLYLFIVVFAILALLLVGLILFAKHKTISSYLFKISSSPPRLPEEKPITDLPLNFELNNINQNLEKVNVTLEKISKILSEDFERNGEEFYKLTNLLGHVAVNESKLFESRETFALQIQTLLHRNLDALNAINENLSANLSLLNDKPSAHQPYPSSQIVVDQELPASFIKSVETTPSIVQASEDFDAFIAKSQNQINKASSNGLDSVMLLVQQMKNLYPVEIDCPSDQVFILFNKLDKFAPQGKVFVLPGQYLGRPWVEWFELPSGVFERVESTVRPATVLKNENGNWSLTEKGLVRQQ